jgi:hypothetical protein
MKYVDGETEKTAKMVSRNASYLYVSSKKNS